MSTDYSHFTNLAFDRLFARGPDGQESLLINSSGTIVGSVSGNLTVTSITTASRSAISGSINSNVQLTVGGTGTVTGATQVGVFQGWKASTGTTVYMNEVANTAGYSGSGTLGAIVAFKASGFTNSGSGNINRTIMFDCTASTTGTLGNAVLSDNSAFSGDYFIHQSGTTQSVFGGKVVVPAGSAASASLTVASAGLGLYRAGAKQLGIAAGAVNIATVTTAAVLIAKALTVTGAASASNLSGSNTGDQTIQLTGNVTGSGTGSFATTIASSAVTNVMIAGSAAISGSKIVSASSSASGVVTTGSQSFAGTKTFTTALAGSNIASASSSASGVVTTGSQSFAGTKTFVTPLTGANVASASSSASGVITTGAQSFAGSKTFTTALAGSNVVSASTSASGVVTTAAQSLGGLKTFVNGFNSTGVSGIGGTNATVSFFLTGNATVNGASSFCVNAAQTIDATVVTTAWHNIFSQVKTTANTGTLGVAHAFNAKAASKGASSTITRLNNYFGDNQTSGTNNSFMTDNSVYTGNWFINSTSTNPSLLSGAVTLGTASTSTHSLNTTVGTNGAVALTLLNGPTGRTGNPADWITINVNGNLRYIPAWA